MRALFIILLCSVVLQSCTWVNAAGRAYEGAGEGLEKAAGETKDGSVSQTLFDVGGKVSKAIGGGLRKVSNHKGAKTNNNGEQPSNQVESINKVLEAQKALLAKGYNLGDADGVMGAKTRSALKEFQSDNNLGASGEINEQTLIALGIEQ